MIRGNVRYDRDLVVVLDLCLDPCGRADARMRAIRSNDEPRRHPLALTCLADNCELRTLRRDLNALGPRGHAYHHAMRSRRRPQLLPKRSTDDPVGHHVPERIDPLLFGPQPREPESARIRNMNGADCCRLGRDVRPYAQRVEDSPTGIA